MSTPTTTPPGTRPGATNPGTTPPQPDDGTNNFDKPQPVDTQPAQVARDEPTGAVSGILAAHNAYREQHCAPPMTWSPDVAAVAQGFADQLRDAGCAFEHSNTQYGENLAMFGPAGTGNPRQVVANWYGEIDKYDFASGGFSMETGHFTQVVWKETTQLGCGVSYCGQDWEIWVCNYAPAGNMRGGYRTNVLPETCN